MYLEVPTENIPQLFIVIQDNHIYICSFQINNKYMHRHTGGYNLYTRAVLISRECFKY
jgi:hypothetical protein